MDSLSFSSDGIHCKKDVSTVEWLRNKNHLTLFGKNSSAFSPKISFERFMERGLMPACKPSGRKHCPS
jgi:hypothetical protein